MAYSLHSSTRVPTTKIIRRKINSLARRLSLPYAPAYPVFAWITPTTRCNLRCITCSRTVNPDWESRDLSPEIYEIVRREILPGLISVELSGTGEPFLAPIFFTILDDVIRLKIEFSVTTNLTILPDDAILGKMMHSPGTLMISIDGTTEKTMTHIRPGLNYEVFCRNLRHVAQLKRHSNNPDFSLRFNFVITRSNVAQMPDVIEQAAEYGVSSIYFSSFMVGNRTDEFTRESLFDSPGIVRPYLEKARVLGERYGISLSPPVFKSQPGKADYPDTQSGNKKTDTSHPIPQCPHPWWSVYIDVDGSVMPCCVFGVPFGNLKEKPFKKIWNGAIYRHFRSIVNTPDMPEGCKHCPLNVRI